MKTSVISPAFREQYLSNPNDPMAFEGPVAVFDGPEDYHHRIETEPEIHPGTILVMRGAGPVGYPGAAEVVNMIPPGESGGRCVSVEVIASSDTVGIGLEVDPIHLITRRSTHQGGHRAPMYRRRSSIRYFGLSLHPQRRARSSHRRHARLPQGRRPSPHRPPQAPG
jgi:hypothetical protein